jgi:hypothetical protein
MPDILKRVGGTGVIFDKLGGMADICRKFYFKDYTAK